jgi:RNA polymerase sigma-70 factor (ECF subfamily)
MDEKISEENRAPSVTRMDSQVTESKLIEAARNGDQKAFGRLVRDHQKRLFRFIYGLTGSFDQTEDIVQEAFVKAYQALNRFEPGRDFYPWLATIARNLAFNQIKRERRKESLDEARERGFDQASGDLGPLEQLIGSEGQKRFYEALKALPESYRTVFVLRHFEDMDYKEIAAQLKIAHGTVDSRLYRARQLLLEALKDML